MSPPVERRMAKITHVSIRDSFVDTFAFEADARTRFAEYKKEATLIWAALHIREGRTYKLIEIWDNTEDLDLEDASPSKPKRIKCIDALDNVAYIHHGGRGWTCTLANGIPAAFSYAVGNCDEVGLRFKLEDCKSDAERMALVVQIAGPRRKVELV